MNPFGLLNFGPQTQAPSGFPQALWDEINARGATSGAMPAHGYSTGGEIGDPSTLPGMLNQRGMPQLGAGPMKMDPGIMPVGLLGRADAPAPGAVEAGPMTQQTAQPGAPMQLPGGAAMQQPQQPEQPQGGLLSSLGNAAAGLGRIYGQGGPGDGLINLGIAVASPGNMAQNVQRANEASNRSRVVNAQLGLQQQKAQGQNQTAKLLSERLGIPVEQAMGLIQSGAAGPALQQAFQKFPVEKPQLVERKRPDGTTEQVWLRPGETTGPVVGSTEAAGAVDEDTLRKERAKAQVKSEEVAVTKRKVYENVSPFLDRAEAAYTKLKGLNAVGPVSASGTSRFIGGVFGTEAEKARQDYEAASKELELMKAQISMKGQGQITESERRILQLTLPRLDAADAETGLTTLSEMRKRFRREAGIDPASPTAAGSPLNAAPSWRILP